MNVGVFKKLKDVLFDVEEELPVITKKKTPIKLKKNCQNIKKKIQLKK